MRKLLWFVGIYGAGLAAFGLVWLALRAVLK
jgi:hypothetical protein